jgi:GAF domain-containing protein
LTAARRLTGAEAGTVYVRDGDTLRFEVVQNDALTRRLGEGEARRRLTQESLSLSEPSFARYAALGRTVVNIPDVYDIPVNQPYVFNPQLDQKNNYRTKSLLAVPLMNADGVVFGVLQLINARDARGDIVAFDAAIQHSLIEVVTGLAQAIPAVRLPS